IEQIAVPPARAEFHAARPMAIERRGHGVHFARREEAAHDGVTLFAILIDGVVECVRHHRSAPSRAPFTPARARRQIGAQTSRSRNIGAPSWTRTSTERFLRPPPLPLGYRSFC